MSQTSYPSTMIRAFAGLLADDGPYDAISRYNSEVSAEMPFGVGVKEGVAEQAALMPSAQTDDVIGVVIHSHAYDKPFELGDDGLKPKTLMSLLRRGRIYVIAEEAVVKGDRGFCRAVAAGAEILGGWRKSADGTDMIDCTKQTQFLTAAGAGEVAVLEVDFLNEPD